MRVIVYGLTAVALILTPGAAWAAHGKPGLWNVTSTVSMPNMPEIPPEALVMMKARHMNIPMPGQPMSNQICMTAEEVNADKPPTMSNQELSCTTKVGSQTASSMSADTVCHGRMEGVGHSQISWRGNDHYEGSYNFKGSAQGHSTEMTTHFTGIG